jgi:hypothetical protein
LKRTPIIGFILHPSHEIPSCTTAEDDTGDDAAAVGDLTSGVGVGVGVAVGVEVGIEGGVVTGVVAVNMGDRGGTMA